MRLLPSALFAVCAVFAAPSVALAAEKPSVDIRIDHGDLDLTTQQDIKVLKHRIRQETTKACTFGDPKRGEAQYYDWTCARNARKDAIAALMAKRDRHLARLER